MGQQCWESGEMCGMCFRQSLFISTFICYQTKLFIYDKYWFIDLKSVQLKKCFKNSLILFFFSDDLCIFGPASFSICWHSRQTGIVSPGCFSTCSPAQLCNPFCHRCSDYRVIPTSSHMHPSKCSKLQCHTTLHKSRWFVAVNYTSCYNCVL